MKKIIVLAAVVIMLAACQKNSAPASVADDNSSASLSNKNSDDAKVNFVKIGTQKWMTTNLNVTHYRNGDRIPEVRSKTAWNKLTTGAWCWYNNDSATGAVYGRLYNWYAVNDPRGLAPEGWHVPANSEWGKLVTGLENEGYVAANELKETGTEHWTAPNNATNSTGFTALPGGERFEGSFSSINSFGFWWTATPRDTSIGYSYFIYSDGVSPKYRIGYKQGLSVRCLKDKPGS